MRRLAYRDLLPVFCGIAMVVSACSAPSSTSTSLVNEIVPGAHSTTAAVTSTEVAPTPETTVPVAVTTTSTLPPVEGPDPSPRVVAFYYPWYADPNFPSDRGPWVHWDQSGNHPPTDIGSDYYPLLGPYSSTDPSVIAQHFAWLRQANVGVIASSWWGRGTYEDRAVGLLLDTADYYGIGVAFHIEPYGGRTADSVARDVEYLYNNYGDHPAFHRTTDSSRWSDDDRPKGLFFIWSAEQPNDQSEYVQPEYWRDAIDSIHSLPDGGIVIADNPDGAWVDGGHFDGLYQYVTLEEAPSFEWARSLPPDAWYVPSVIPGFSAKRIQYDDSTYTARDGGKTYQRQWDAALSTGIEPHLVTITSFNEWHEGTQIEPATPDARCSSDEAYDGYGDLGSGGYLDLTAALVTAYAEMPWETIVPQRIRIDMETSSDWTTLTLVSGGELIQPVILSVGDDATLAFEGTHGERLGLFQSLDDATAGRSVQASIKVGVLDMGETMTFRIERGAIGYTEITVTSLIDGQDSSSSVTRWDGWSDDLVDGESGRNPLQFDVSLKSP